MQAAAVSPRAPATCSLRRASGKSSVPGVSGPRSCRGGPTHPSLSPLNHLPRAPPPDAGASGVSASACGFGGTRPVSVNTRGEGRCHSGGRGGGALGRADEPAPKEPREGGYGVIGWWGPAGKERAGLRHPHGYPGRPGRRLRRPKRRRAGHDRAVKEKNPLMRKAESGAWPSTLSAAAWSSAGNGESRARTAAPSPRGTS